MASVEGGAMSSPLWLMRTLTDPSDSFDVRKKAAENANPNPKPNFNPKPKRNPNPKPNPNPSPSPKPTQAAENGYLAFADRGRPLRADDDGVGPSGPRLALRAGLGLGSGPGFGFGFGFGCGCGFGFGFGFGFAEATLEDALEHDPLRHEADLAE